MKNTSLSMLFVFIAFTSCDLFNNENDLVKVTSSIYEGELTIRNGLPIDVYYFAIDQESLPYIDWAPLVSEQNKLIPEAFVSIDMKAENSPISYDDGETIVVYYWDEDISEIFSILIE